MEPRTLQFDQAIQFDQVLLPPILQQPNETVEFVYPNDGESQFYTYEQMCNDWVPSDIECESSSDEEEDMCTDDYYNDW